MKNIKNLALSILMSIAAAIIFTACSEDDSIYSQPADSGSQRTVLIYMAGRNNLSNNSNIDLDEVMRGSKLIGSDQSLVVFMRNNDQEEPWLARVENGELTNKVTISEMGINKDIYYASDPDVMEQVIKYAFSHYPSAKNDYGLVLWGHSGGWVIQESVEDTRGYGVDKGDYIYSRGGKWINIPTMNNLLARLPHLKFIFADCCNFMCLETLYELRNTADYIIGSPAEIPAEGAPYESVVPAMFEPTTFYRTILNLYHENRNGQLPLSVVKTSEMEHVAQATRTVMDKIASHLNGTYPDMNGMIHYNYMGPSLALFHQQYNIFYDAGDFIHTYATEADYQQWKQVLDAAVIDKRFGKTWRTNDPWSIFYTDFEMTEERYHGVSMFVPQDSSAEYSEPYIVLNEDIKQLQWYNAIFQEDIR